MQSHKIIAYHLHHHIKQNLNINLNRNFLIYGAMKPDIAPSLAIKKHYKEQSFDFVLDEILKLTLDGLKENAISINKFSTRLGVISHFLSDFFCLPHHDRQYYHDKLMEHLKYEKDLHGYFSEFNGIDKVNIPYVENMNKENIKDVIENLHDIYKNNSMGFKNDIIGSINISSAIGITIVENSLITSLEKVTV